MRFQTAVTCGFALLAVCACAEDWTMWGRTPDRNMIVTEKGIPTEWDVEKGTNIKYPGWKNVEVVKVDGQLVTRPIERSKFFRVSWYLKGVLFRQRMAKQGYRPQAGDTIGFNVAVGDDDNGGSSYLRSEPAPHTDSYTAWDGRSLGWYVFAERDWGNLYFAPHNH